jgi:hypothetical protein
LSRAAALHLLGKYGSVACFQANARSQFLAVIVPCSCFIWPLARVVTLFLLRQFGQCFALYAYSQLGVSVEDETMRTSKLICLLVFLALGSPKPCFSESEVLSHSVDLGGAVEDADISPSGEYTAAAVRKCALSDGNPTCTLDIEVWGTRDTKRLARRMLLPNVRDVAVAIRFSADGRSLVISEGQGKLRLWDISDLIESNSFDLGLTDEDVQDLSEKQEKEYVRRFGQHPKVRSVARVVQIETSPTSPLVGAVVRVGGAEIIRVLDLTSGKLLQSWSFMDAVSYKGAPALSWSQDGKRIAISLPDTRGLKHPERTDPADLLIFDAISGQLSAKFEVREDWERGLIARGRAIFAGDNLMVSTHRTPDTFFRPTVRILDDSKNKCRGDWSTRPDCGFP